MSRQSHHLISEQQDCLEAELAGAKVEEILQAGPQQLHHHHIVVTFCSTPLYCGNAHCKNNGVNTIIMVRTQNVVLSLPEDVFHLLNTRLKAFHHIFYIII